MKNDYKKRINETINKEIVKKSFALRSSCITIPEFENNSFSVFEIMLSSFMEVYMEPKREFIRFLNTLYTGVHFPNIDNYDNFYVSTIHGDLIAVYDDELNLVHNNLNLDYLQALKIYLDAELKVNNYKETNEFYKSYIRKKIKRLKNELQ